MTTTNPTPAEAAALAAADPIWAAFVCFAREVTKLAIATRKLGLFPEADALAERAAEAQARADARWEEMRKDLGI
jgi:hypothetical protein